MMDYGINIIRLGIYKLSSLHAIDDSLWVLHRHNSCNFARHIGALKDTSYEMIKLLKSYRLELHTSYLIDNLFVKIFPTGEGYITYYGDKINYNFDLTSIVGIVDATVKLFDHPQFNKLNIPIRNYVDIDNCRKFVNLFNKNDLSCVGLPLDPFTQEVMREEITKLKKVYMNGDDKDTITHHREIVTKIMEKHEAEND